MQLKSVARRIAAAETVARGRADCFRPEEDLLDPQEGDYLSEHTWHHWVVRKLCEILEELFVSRGRGEVLVGGNLQMLWTDPQIKRVAPDVVGSASVVRQARKIF